MGFSKTELRAILKENGAETISSDLLTALCDLHTDTQTEVVKAEKAKFKAEDTKEYKDLQSKYDELAEKADVKIEDTEQYKKIVKEFDDYKQGVENGKKAETLKSLKRAELEKLGLKGSALELLVKDESLNFEVDETGKAKDLEAFTKQVSDNYSDLIVVEKGVTGATVPKGTGNGNAGITKEQFSKMTYNQRVELKNKSPELYKNLKE